MGNSTTTTYGDDCVLMLQCEGTQGSTTITDSSYITPKTVTANSSAHIDCRNVKFGTGALQFTRATFDSAYSPDSPDWLFSNNDFQIDLWMMPSSITAVHSIIGQWQNTTGSKSLSWLWYYSATGISFTDSQDGSTQNDLYTWAYAISAGVYTHLCVNRSGQTVRLFVNGSSLLARTNTCNLFNSTAELMIGYNITTAGIQGNWQDGLIDSVRIIKGNVTWASDFTPPSAAYTQDTGEFLRSFLNLPLLGVG